MPTFCFWRSNCSWSCWSFRKLEMTSFFFLEWHPIRMVPIGSPDSFNVHSSPLRHAAESAGTPHLTHLRRGLSSAKTLDSKNGDTCRNRDNAGAKRSSTTISEDSFSKRCSELRFFLSWSLIKNIHIFVLGHPLFRAALSTTWNSGANVPAVSSLTSPVDGCFFFSPRLAHLKQRQKQEIPCPVS